MDDIETRSANKGFVISIVSRVFDLTSIAERTDLWHAKCPPCISGKMHAKSCLDDKVSDGCGCKVWPRRCVHLAACSRGQRITCCRRRMS